MQFIFVILVDPLYKRGFSRPTLLLVYKPSRNVVILFPKRLRSGPLEIFYNKGSKS